MVGEVQRMHNVYRSHPELGAGLRDELHGSLQQMLYSAQRLLRSLTKIVQSLTYIRADKLRHYIHLTRHFCTYRYQYIHHTEMECFCFIMFICRQHTNQYEYRPQVVTEITTNVMLIKIKKKEKTMQN